MAQWSYIKGSALDFQGYRDTTIQIRKRRDNGLTFGSDGYPSDTDWLSDVIAERQSALTLTTPTEALITERGIRYGEFKDGAAIMQQLKDVMHTAPKWDALKPSQKEALEMIQHKIGRILNGDPNYDDNWKDIAGYATLIVKEIEG
jgi:hypothetical protein